MNMAEKVFEEVRTLPEFEIQEVLDFVGFLKTRRGISVLAASNDATTDWNKLQHHARDLITAPVKAPDLALMDEVRAKSAAASPGPATNYTTVVFADTNIVVYAYGVDPVKVAPAKTILNASPVISTQVIGEFHSVARRKLGLDIATRHRVATDLLKSCRIIAIDQAIVAAAMQIEARYQVSYWDALILTAALVAGCDTLYSEDMQNGQVFEDRLTVKNPFVSQ